MNSIHSLKRSKQYLIILLMVLVIGVLSNAFYYYFSYMSQAAEIQELDTELEMLGQREQQLSKGDLPIQITEDEIQILLHQLPFSAETPRLLVGLREIEETSGVIIKNYRFSGIENSWEEFSTMVDEESTSSDETQSNSDDAESILSKKTITLSMEANYLQLINFFKEIYQLERITAINNWKINPKLTYKDGITEEEILELIDNPMLEVILDLEIYKTDKYETISDGLDPLSANDPEPPFSEKPYSFESNTL